MKLIVFGGLVIAVAVILAAVTVQVVKPIQRSELDKARVLSDTAWVCDIDVDGRMEVCSVSVPGAGTIVRMSFCGPLPEITGEQYTKEYLERRARSLRCKTVL